MLANLGYFSIHMLNTFMALSNLLMYSVYSFRNGAHLIMTSPILLTESLQTNKPDLSNSSFLCVKFINNVVVVVVVVVVAAVAAVVVL